MNHFDPRQFFWSDEDRCCNSPIAFLFNIRVFSTQSQRKKEFYTSNQNFKKPPIDPPRCQKKLTRVLAIQLDLPPRIMRFHTSKIVRD